MTYAAREVLADCRVALQLLEEETDLQRWRVHWAAAVALTRAVGHVLDKVDGEDACVRTVANAAFNRWKTSGAEDEIFREFIDRERNNILKKYRFALHPLEEVQVAVTLTLQDPATGELSQTAEVLPIGDNIYRPVLDGYRAGDDARDVLGDALDWWNRQLDAIDATVRCLASAASATSSKKRAGL